MNFKYLLWLAMFLPASLFAQNYFGYEPHQAPPANYFPNADSLEKAIIRNIPDSLAKEEWIDDYVYEYRSYIQQLLNPEYTYAGWTEMESYLNKIVQQLATPEEIEQYNLHMYPVLNPTINASATSSGVMFANIGLLAFAKDEAMLAEVIGHEIAHVKHYDGVHSYKHHVETKGKRTLAGISALVGIGGIAVAIMNSLYGFNRQQETNADVAGWEMMVKAGYDLSSGFYSYELFELIENRYEEKRSLNLTVNTHPRNEDRTAMLKEFIEKQGNYKGKPFVVDEKAFYRLKEFAKVEMLKQLYRNHEYNECMERALQFHIFDSDNPIYIYYILEGLRKYTYAYIHNTLGDIEKRDFIMHRHYLRKSETGSKQGYGKLTGSILSEKNQPYALYATQEEIDAIKTHELIDKTEEEFESFNEALAYFTQKAEETNCTECYLSIGLYHHLRNNYWEEKPKKDWVQDEAPWLKKYIASENPRYKAYAEAVLKGTTFDKLTKDVVILNEFKFSKIETDTSKDYRAAYKAYDEVKEDLEKFYTQKGMVFTTKSDSTFSYEDRAMVKELLGLYDYIKDVYAMSTNSAYKFVLADPRYWEFANKHQMAKLYFLRLRDERDFKNFNGKYYYYFYLTGLGFNVEKSSLCKTSYSGYFSGREGINKYLEKLDKKAHKYYWNK